MIHSHISSNFDIRYAINHYLTFILYIYDILIYALIHGLSKESYSLTSYSLTAASAFAEAIGAFASLKFPCAMRAAVLQQGLLEENLAKAMGNWLVVSTYPSEK